MVQITVCPRRDLHEGESEWLVVNGHKYFVVEVSYRGIIHQEPSPSFVQAFLKTTEDKRLIGFRKCSGCKHIEKSVTILMAGR